MQTYQDRKTPEMVEALRQFWLDLEEVQMHDPTFFGYQHDLDLGNDVPAMESSTVNGRKWHFAPDQHYFKVCGTAPEPARISTFRQVLIWCLAWVLVGELILILWPGVL